MRRGKVGGTKRISTSVTKENLLYLLPSIKLPEPPYTVYYEFGFSSAASDIDNPVKLLQDILQKKYSFDDKLRTRNASA